MAANSAPRFWNTANITLFGAIGGILLAGAYLRQHPASTVGPGYHTSDKAPSADAIKKSEFAARLDAVPPAPAAGAPPSRVAPTTSAAKAARSSKVEL